MNKKFLSAILFGALMVTSTGTFVSCKDYDDDIDNLQTQINSNKEAIAALQKLVGDGNWVTGVTAIDNGIRVTMSNGQSAEITGINGEDGKNGTVVTIVDGFWAFDGVKSEYPAVPAESSNGQDAHEIKIEDGYWCIWNSEKEAYEKTPYAVAPVNATQNTNGSWTITVKNPNGEDDVINIPATALAHIEVISPSHESELNKMDYNYGIVREDVKWGWSKDKVMGAGLYSKLGTDMTLLLNPAGVQGDTYSYTLKNSNGAEAPVKFFETAEPYAGPALARSTSSNGLWTLPAYITKNEASKIETLRRELYLYFKANDSKYYDLAVEATSAEGAKVFSDYVNKVQVVSITGKEELTAMEDQECLINKAYYPVFAGTAAGKIYDYELRLSQDAENLKKAAVYGATVTDNGHAWIATKEAGVYNPIKYDITYVLLDGSVKEIKNQYVEVLFTSELTGFGDPWVLEDQTLYQGAPLNATYVSTDANGHKIFAYATKEYDLTEKVNALSDIQKLVWNQAVAKGTASDAFSTELIGGDGENNTEYNNNEVKQHISYTIKDNKIKFTFYVSSAWNETDNAGEYVGIGSNFMLDKAYQYTITVVDPDNHGAGVAEIILPFEFTLPTLDITRINGKYSAWDNAYDADDKVIEGVKNLYAYGYKRNTAEAGDYKMGLQLHDAFNAWKPVDNDKVTAPYQKYVENAIYYGLTFDTPTNTTILGKAHNLTDAYVTLEDNTATNLGLKYAGLDTESNTRAMSTVIAAKAKDDVELTIPMEVDYKFYGVYDSGEDDINLIFASWLKHSKLETVNEVYTVERGQNLNYRLFTNDDLNLVNPKGGKFYLFDDIAADGITKYTRDAIPGSTNDYNHYPFTGYNANAASANDIAGLFEPVSSMDNTATHFTAVLAGDKKTPVKVIVKTLDETDIKVDESTGNRYIDPAKVAADDTAVTIYQVPSVAQSKDEDVVGDIAKAFRGGMLVQLPNKGVEQDGVVITVTLKDFWGYTNSFDFTLNKAQ